MRTRLSLASLDGLLRENTSARRHQVLIVVLISLGVVGAGAVTLNHSFRDLRTAKFDPSRDFDMDFPMYLEPSTLQAFADEMGAGLRGFSVASRSAGKLRSGLSSDEGNVTVSRVGPRKLLVSADVKTAARVWIGQTYSPLWKILPSEGFSSNLPIPVSVSPRGLLELSVPPGNDLKTKQMDIRLSTSSCLSSMLKKTLRQPSRTLSLINILNRM